MSVNEIAKYKMLVSFNSAVFDGSVDGLLAAGWAHLI